MVDFHAMSHMVDSHVTHRMKLVPYQAQGMLWV